MSTKKNKPPLKLGMDFDEALHRFAKVDPKEIPDRFILKKKGAKKPPPDVSGAGET